MIPTVAALIAPMSLAMIFSFVSSAGVSQVASGFWQGSKFGWGEPEGNTSNCNAAAGR